MPYTTTICSGGMVGHHKANLVPGIHAWAWHPCVGNTVYFTPENKAVKKLKNYDAIIDGRLGEFKQLKSFKQIRNRLNEADGQRASTVCLEPPMKNHTLDEVRAEVNNWFKYSQHKIGFVDTVLLIWEGQVIPIKK
jgi:hypothetical protein